MRMCLFIFLAMSSILICQPRNTQFAGGPHGMDQTLEVKCISDQERAFVMENRIDVDHQSMRDTVLFQDPIGNGGMMNLNDSVKHHIWNYVDQNNQVGWILDYNCYYVTYDGHQGTDITIGGFYYMDEMMTPVIAAAPGIVTYSHDGEFDRQVAWINGAVANGVIISHSDGTSGWYWHFKKNTVAVDVGDSVGIGDTLGFVGSSGYSSGAHLHFEVEGTGGFHKDPWEGQCGDGPSRWVDQLPFVGDTSVYESALLSYLTTSYPINGNGDTLGYVVSENLPDMQHINRGGDYLSAVWIRNLFSTDTLRRKFYRDGELVDETYWVPGNSVYWLAGIEYYTTSFWYFWGTWDTDDGALGNWTEQFLINSKLVGEKSYVCDDIPNQSPEVDFQQMSVELGQTITGEFSVTDDGAPFWFNLESEPNNGGDIELYGGRKRKFEYTAPNDFIGYDVIGVSATDDMAQRGGMTFIIFDVSGSGLTNLTVEPSFILPQESVMISADILGESDGFLATAHIVDNISGDVSHQEMENNDNVWSVDWMPETESFFSVNIEFVNVDENDTTMYEDVGNFTSVGPVSVSMADDMNGSLGDVLITEFIVSNQSTDQMAPDVTVSFEAESMACLDALSMDPFYMGDIEAGNSVGSGGYFFAASINHDCNEDSTIIINVNISSGEDEYWEDEFWIEIDALGTDDEDLPVKYSLSDAFPNPFNPSTKIRYGVPKKDLVSIAIHDVVGRHVKTLVSTEKDPGFHEVQWDATNDQGAMVSAGMYFYVIRSGGFIETKKMILLK